MIKYKRIPIIAPDKHHNIIKIMMGLRSVGLGKQGKQQVAGRQSDVYIYCLFRTISWRKGRILYCYLTLYLMI